MPKKILLADDSVTIQKVVELTFAEGDYEVTCVSNGRAALERLKASRPDILLCDIIMPELSGYEVAETVKKDPNFKGIPVILLTGTFEPFDEEKARQSGADTYITKPFDSRMLVEKVESLLQERLVMDVSLPQQSMEVLTGQGQSMTVLPPPPPVEALQAVELPPVEAAVPVPPPAPPVAPAEALSSAGESFPQPQFAPAPPATPAPGAFSFGSSEASPFEASSPFAGEPEVPESAPVVEAVLSPPPPAAPEMPPVVAEAAAPAVMDFGDFSAAPHTEEPFEAAHVEPPAPDMEAALPPPVLPEAPVSVEPEGSSWSPVGSVAEEAFAQARPGLPEVPQEAAAPPEPAYSEPELPPAAGMGAGPEMAPQASAPLPPFVEEQLPEPELERAVWAESPGVVEPAAPVSGLVHEMTEQQEMVSEAHAYETSAEPDLPQDPHEEEVFQESAPETEAAWGEEAASEEIVSGEPATAASVAVAPAPQAVASQIDEAQLEAIVRKVLAEMVPGLVQQVAWEVIPELAESLIKRRIQELESQVE